MSKENINFECSRETKQLYLGTRKKEMTYGGFSHPGLFSTYNYSRDTTLFYIACILEIAGLALIVYYANIDLAYSATIAIFAFALDIIFALWHHSPQSKLQEAIIRKVLEEGETGLELLDRKIRSLKQKKILLTLPLILMAAAKIVIFFGAYADVDMIMVAIVVSYILVALIHIYVTGYYLAEYRRSSKEKNEFSKYLNKKTGSKIFDASEKFNEFESKYDLSIRDHNTYKLNKSENSKYKISAIGVLMDSELQNLLKDQNNGNSEFIVNREGLRLQYNRILPHQSALNK